MEEMKQIVWNEKKDDMDPDHGIHSDRVDALIYSMRYIYNHIRHEEKREIPENEKREREIDEQMQKEFDRQNRRTWNRIKKQRFS